MKKKRYTKPVVIDLGKQTPQTIKNGLLIWNRNGSSSDKTESCAEGAAYTQGCNTEDHNTISDGIKDDSDKE